MNVWTRSFVCALALVLASGVPSASADEGVTEADDTVVERATHKDGAPKAEIRTKAGVKHGLQVEWSSSGARHETTYDHGVKHGPFRRYWPNGNKQTEGNYEHGLKSGSWTEFNRKGEVTFTKTFLYGERIGLLQQLEDGRGSQKGRRVVVGETPYLLGLKHGTATTYDREGKIASRGAYVLGQREGIWESYGSDGRVRKSVTYSCGRKLERTVETAGGDVVICRPPFVSLSRPNLRFGSTPMKNRTDAVQAQATFHKRVCELLKDVGNLEVSVDGKPLRCSFGIRTETPTVAGPRG